MLNSSAGFIRYELPRFKEGNLANLGFAPSMHDLLMPWVGSFISPADISEMFNIIKKDEKYTDLSASFETEPSNICLMPAPGEEFSLFIKSLDEMLGNVSTSAYLQVRSARSSQQTTESVFHMRKKFCAFEELGVQPNIYK